MRILITSRAGAGHFGPLRPFAGALRDAGHELLVAIQESGVGMAEAAGHAAWPLEEAPREQRAPVFERAMGRPSEESNAIVIGELFAGLDARAAVPGAYAAVAEFLPDLIVHESCEFSGPLAAERAAIASAHVSIGLGTVGASVTGWVAPSLDQLRGELGLAPDPGGERVYARPMLSLTPPALDGAVRAHRFRAPRPDAAPAPRWWADDDERPLVYLSFGSVAPTTPMYPRLYRAAIERLAPLPSRLLVSTGRRDPAELGRLPANVHVERWVDEDAIGHHAAAMVSHGGAGSIRGALAAGVPLVVLPLFAEQPDNAAAVAATGAGIAVEGVAGIDDALRVLLADAAYARRAQAIAAEIAALPPVSEAVRLLAQIADSTSSAARSPVATAPFR